MKRQNKINRVKEKAKKTTGGMIGINVNWLKLTNEEKKKLVSDGFYFSSNRNKDTTLHYSQQSRERDLREKVNRKFKKMEKHNKLMLQYEKTYKDKKHNEYTAIEKELTKYNITTVLAIDLIYFVNRSGDILHSFDL